MEIEHISISRANLWAECPYRYKLHYFLKVPSPEPEQFFFTYGKICHAIAEHFVRNQGEISLNEIANNVLKGKIPIDGKSERISLPQEYKERFPGHLRAIESLTKKIGYEGELECPFTIDLDPPNNKLLTGVIDRLIPKNDKYFIIDYKTTKKGRFRKNPLSIKYDMQLRAYAWAIQQKFNVDIDNIRVALYYLEGSSLICGKFMQRFVDEAIKELRETYDEIKNTDPHKVVGHVGEWCRRCEYKTQCHYFRG